MERTVDEEKALQAEDGGADDNTVSNRGTRGSIPRTDPELVLWGRNQGYW